MIGRIKNFKQFIFESESNVEEEDKIVSDNQYALIYALSSNNEPGTTQKKSWFDKLGLEETSDEWYIHAGMKPGTVSRMLTQYKMLLQGIRISTHKQKLFPRIIEAFDGFENMGKDAVIVIANKALDEAPKVVNVKLQKKQEEIATEAKRTELAKTFTALSQRFGGTQQAKEKAARQLMSKVGMTQKQFLSWVS
jgi:hypothetical protein